MNEENVPKSDGTKPLDLPRPPGETKPMGVAPGAAPSSAPPASLISITITTAAPALLPQNANFVVDADVSPAQVVGNLRGRLVPSSGNAAHIIDATNVTTSNGGLKAQFTFFIPTDWPTNDPTTGRLYVLACSILLGGQPIATDSWPERAVQ